MHSELKEEVWDLEINPSQSLFQLNLKAVWKYRDLLFLFVKRDIITVYKQTVLGPVWFFVQPILTTLIFTFIFGNIAGISSDGLPKILFYLSGITIWNYFSDSFLNTSKTFIDNANIFGKVYFPRLILPLSKVISGLIKFLIQFALLIVVYLYFKIFNYTTVTPTIFILIIPFLILLMAGIGLGFGIIISSMTTKYRDLSFLVAFGVQLLMYATPVIYPLSSISGKYRFFIEANPMTGIIEAFRFGLFGKGSADLLLLSYTTLFTIVILFIGIVTFNKVEKSFVDTV